MRIYLEKGEDEAEREKRLSLLNKCVRQKLLLFVELEWVDRWPNMRKALVFAATIALTSASCERTFSTLKCVKNILRTTMLDERLSLLITCYCESDIVKGLDNSDVM